MHVPRRIVSLVPSTTETVCLLGAAERLVGCTRYCTEPADALARVARIGGTKNPALERIAALAPDLVLGNAEENREEDLDWLRARVPVLVQTPLTVAAAAADLRELAVRLGVPDAAAPFTAAVDAHLREHVPERRPLRVLYVIWRKPWMSIGASTFVHDVLRLSGATNVCADASARYPEVVPADVVAAGVDAVLLASEPWEFDARQRRELRAERVFGDAALVLCDGRDFCWHGVRMAEGLARARTVVREAASG